MERDDDRALLSTRERERDRRRSPCLSRMEREESRDLTLDELRLLLLLRLLSEDELEDAHFTNKIKKINVEAKPRIQPK